MKKDFINHPPHYKSKPIECIEISERMDFCLGNAFKYLYRYKDKGKPIEDLQKAIWYINRKVEKIKKHPTLFVFHIDMIKLNKILEFESKNIKKTMEFLTLFPVNYKNLKSAIKYIKKEIEELKKEK